MSNIIDFTAQRLAKCAAPKPTLGAVIVNAMDFLLGEWERMARSNRLNDYFKFSLPHSIDQQTKTNFMSELGEIAKLELKLDVYPMVFFPGTIKNEQIGWVVQYKFKDELICTPEMASECYARAFGILLYLKVKGDALSIRM